MLTGTFRRSVDDKLRIAIPKRFRDVIADGETAIVLYIAPGTDGTLTLYTEASFQRLADQLGAASPAQKDVRAFSRLFFARAESVEVDGQGRIRIPGELAKHCPLKKEAMLIGVRDRMEIWETQKWEQYVSENEQEYDELAEKALAPKT